MFKIRNHLSQNPIPYIDVGITWWLEHVNTLIQPSVDVMMEWVKQGSPKG